MIGKILERGSFNHKNCLIAQPKLSMYKQIRIIDQTNQLMEVIECLKK
ncbi:hypothetical protein SAMN05421677_12523 [Halobacillus aidingensis]|uniref:Uncharacterized protein n=1 Tax=Halobacillus aidingensis TaxID=240303 RepID=A0A1H0UCB1_HALAD|nr:hypothetical protein SAMN05421677_12523 [Halobacillus aidingensis]